MCYKRANFAQLDDLLRLFILVSSFIAVLMIQTQLTIKQKTHIMSYNWECLREGSVNDCCELFTNKFMEFVNPATPYKNVTVRPSDKPWYDTEIRKYSRKHDRLKSKAIKSSSFVRLE